MSGTDMKGISQGNKVVLPSDVDLNTGEGQAVAGHELSHIHDNEAEARKKYFDVKHLSVPINIYGSYNRERFTDLHTR